MPSREDKKRHDDELLVTHKPATAPSPDKLAHNRAPAALQREEFEMMRKQVHSTTDAAARRELVARMQQRFGNAKTSSVVRELRREHPEHADGNLPGRSAPAAGKKGKA